MVNIRQLFTGSLSVLIEALNPHTAGIDDALALAHQLKAIASPGTPRAIEAGKLLCLTKDEYGRFSEEVDAFLRHEAPADTEPKPFSTRNAELAMLRVLLWFETARSNKSPLKLPDGGPARPGQLEAFRLVSALELLMRELLRQQHPDNAAVRSRLEQLLPSEAAGAIKRRPDDPIAGLYLKDLIRLYVDASEWERIDPLYRESAFLRLLRERRLTAERFLEDVRRIRNDVAHLRPLTAVQHELLVRYYQELVEPIREAHHLGRTAANPAKYEPERTQAEFDVYRRTALDELTRDTRSSRRLAWVSLSVSLTLLAIVMAVQWPTLRVKLDPDLDYVNAVKADPSSLGINVIEACSRGHLAAMTRLAESASAAQALKGALPPQLNFRINAMAAREPTRLRPCIPVFAKMGWDPNTVGGNTVGSLLEDTQTPEGYRGYLQSHAAGIAPGKAGTAPELRCPVLVLAVWHADAELVSALVAAGARPVEPCIVDAVWLDLRNDGTFLSALEEARRIGKPELLRALGG